MESSSDESFVWTNASSDSSENNLMVINNNSNNDDMMKRHTSKKSVNEQNDTQHQITKTKIKQDVIDSDDVDSTHKKIKTEPDSDAHNNKNKKKSKYKDNIETDYHNSISYDESFLDMKVKLEQTDPWTCQKNERRDSFSTVLSTSWLKSEPTVKDETSMKPSKRKEKRIDISNRNHTNEESINQLIKLESIESDTSQINKKKAKRIKNNSINEDDEERISEGKTNAVETVAESSKIKTQKGNKEIEANIHMSDHRENSVSQETTINKSRKSKHGTSFVNNSSGSESSRDEQHKYKQRDSFSTSQLKSEPTVKDETSIKKTRKKDKRIDISIRNHINGEYVRLEPIDGEISQSKQKKTKRIKNNRIVNGDNQEMITESKFSAEETVVKTQQKKIKTRKSKKIQEADIEISEHKEDSASHEITIDRHRKNKHSTSFVSNDSSSDSSGDEQSLKKNSIGNGQRENNNTSDIDGGGKTEQNKYNLNSNNIPDKITQRVSKLSERMIYEDESKSDINNSTVCHSPENYDSSSVDSIQQSYSKVSNKIKFKSDSEEETAHIDKKNGTHSSQLDHLLKINSNLKPLLKKLPKKSVITEDDDIWILKCPQEIDIKSLQDIDIMLDNKCKMKVNGQTYTGIIDEDITRVPLLTNDKHNRLVISNMPVKGAVTFHKRIPKPQFIPGKMTKQELTNFIPLPDTKCRHPLFGSNYKKAINIPAPVTERLKAAVNDAIPIKSKRKKQNRERECREHEQEASATWEPQPEVEISRNERKRKRKHHSEHSQCESAGHSDQPASTPPTAHKRPKLRQINHNSVSAETWESEKAIEENLFNF